MLIYHKALNLIQFDCEVTPVPVPATNQYQAMKLTFFYSALKSTTGSFDGIWAQDLGPNTSQTLYPVRHAVICYVYIIFSFFKNIYDFTNLFY